jgi:catecholate siderophore receptor
MTVRLPTNRIPSATTLGSLGVALTSLVIIPASHAADTENAAADTSDASAGGDVDQVTVNGVRSLLHDKLPGDVENTPQSITLVPPKLIEEQSVIRLQDALKNVPGITLNAGEGGARGDTVNLRGFSAFNDFFLDGVRDAAVYTRDAFDLETLEVFKGPSAILFGRGSTGGAINQVSKAPTLNGFESATLNVGTNHLYRATADVDVPLGASAAFRFNVMDESSDVAGRDYVQNRRWGLAPSLAFGIGESTSVVLTFLHQQEGNVPDSGVPFLDGRPANVPRESYYGLASDRDKTRDDIGTLRIRHDFGDSLTVADTVRYANYEFSYLQSQANFGDDPPTAATPPESILVGRDAPSSAGTLTNLTNQLDVTWRVDTGPVHHTVVAGMELSRQTSDLERYVNPFNNDNTWIPETPLFAPNPNEASPVEPVSSRQFTDAHSTSFYATDTMALTHWLDFIAGIRHDRFSADYDQITEATGAVLNLRHVDRVNSPRGALVFKPTATQNYYFSYGTSFDPSAEALALTTKTANLGPVKAKSYEAGAKENLLDNQLLLTGALFRTTVDNAQTNDPENPTVTTLNGNQRVQGVELGATGYVAPHVELTAGYTYLDGKTISSGTAAFVGKQLANVARNAVNLWAEYEISDAWEVGAGGNWLDRRYADFAQTVSLPGYVVFNAMSSYKLTRNVDLQLNVFNIANKLYYDGVYYTSVSENHVLPGAGRSARLTVHAKF